MQASGFKLTNNEIFALIKKTKLNSNNTDVEFLVLKHLMSRTSTYIDDLSDDLFISSTSLLKIIKKINIEITEAIPAPKYAVKLNKRAYMKLINTYLTYFIIIIISPFDEI